jgi:hypothetical protein
MLKANGRRQTPSHDKSSLDLWPGELIKGDEVIKKLPNLPTNSTETTCLSYLSS